MHTNNNFAVAIQLLLQASVEGKPKHEAVLEVCSTPQYLLDAGFPDLKVVIKGKTVDKAHFDHGITRGMLERLPDMVLTPKALYRSATHPDSAVVVSFEQKDGSPILVPMHKQAPVGRETRNVVASIYCKEATVEARWQKEGLLLWRAPTK
jgi:Phage MuF-C-terminal domain